MPEVSVVITLWNKEPYIRNTIESVINQTVKDFEILVVDDGSTDRGVEVVKIFGDPRIRLIMQSNQGVSAARNTGISESVSDLIAFLDADDEWMPTYLETIMGLYKRYPQAGVFATAYKLRMPDGSFRRPRNRYLPSHPWNGILNYFRAALGNNPAIMTSGAVVKKAVFEQVGGFADTFPEDLEMWARIAFKYSLAWSSRVETIWRRDVGSSLLRTAKPTGDQSLISTLIKGRSEISSRNTKIDIENLTGKYYKYYAIAYMKAGDKENAVRCLRESIRYLRGGFLIKPAFLGIILLFPRRVWRVLQFLRV
jgi:glycosyltransferase involved in cell wall biosynthesis